MRVSKQDERCLSAVSSCFYGVSEPQKGKAVSALVLRDQGEKRRVNSKFIDQKSLTLRVTHVEHEKTRLNFMVSDWNWRLSWFSM